MILKKFFVFAVLACASACAGRRFVSWSGTALCIYKLNNDTPVAALPDAANLSQADVFAWLKEHNIFSARAFHVWATQVYKHAFGYGWRLEWPNLFLAKDVEINSVFCLLGGPGRNVHFCWRYFYEPLLSINVENLTADQLRDKLQQLPTEAIDQIVREFENHSMGVDV